MAATAIIMDVLMAALDIPPVCTPACIEILPSARRVRNIRQRIPVAYVNYTDAITPTWFRPSIG